MRVALWSRAVGAGSFSVAVLAGCGTVLGLDSYQVAPSEPSDAGPDGLPDGPDDTATVRQGPTGQDGTRGPGGGEPPTGNGTGEDGQLVTDGDAPLQPPDRPPSGNLPPSVELCTAQGSFFDALYAAIAADLALLDPAAARRTRYISLTNRFVGGQCASGSLERDRDALVKLSNMLSTESAIEVPVAIDGNRTLYRIDLASYGWDQAVSVLNPDATTSDFTNKWQAIVANDPYAIPFVGGDADAAGAASGTNVPVLFADSMLDTASVGNLYYALIGVDVLDTLDDFIGGELQIDVAQNLVDQAQIRAGTSRSELSRQDRAVQRDAIGIRPGVLWQAFDFADDQIESVFDDPFGFAEAGTEAIFSLPNGLFGFIIADERSVIVESADLLLDTNQNDFRVRTSVSCSGCHEQGLLPVVDEVRAAVLADPTTAGLNSAEVEQIEAIYPPGPEFARLVDADNQAFQRALGGAGLPLEGGDPLSFVFLRFDQDMNLADAAGDLGVTPQVLEGKLSLLAPELAVLAGGGVIGRDEFTALYASSLCVLAAGNNNQPSRCVASVAPAP